MFQHLKSSLKDKVKDTIREIQASSSSSGSNSHSRPAAAQQSHLHAGGSHRHNHGPPPVPPRLPPRMGQGYESAHGGGAPPIPPEPQSSLVNGAYYPNWAVYKQGPPSSLNLRCLSHVFYAFAHVKPDGTVYISDEYADTQIQVDGVKGCLRAFGKLKTEYPHLKVILSVGGGGKGGEHFAEVARDERARQVFAYTAYKMVTEYGLDGIDIDWEHPKTSHEGQHYISLLHEIRRYLPAPTYLLTSALPAAEWALKNINLSRAAHYLDFINVMAYDFSGPWVPQAGHQAQLYTPTHPHCEHAVHSGHTAISYFKEHNVPVHKLLLGIPVYGRSFLGVERIGQKSHGQGGEDGVFLYTELPRPGAREMVDTTVGAAYSVGGDGGFVTYDNPETVRMKAGYVRQMGLGGIFFWTGAADVRTGERSLVEASHRALNG